MAGKPLKIICIGRMRQAPLRDAAGEYARRIERFRPFVASELRDADAALTVEERMAVEGRRILEALEPKDLPLVLDERGKGMSSPDFAALLRQMDESAAGRPCFVIGGAWGLADEVRARAHRLISLSAMTLPHELARVFLLEQIYRAQCINSKIPYHH